MPGSTIEVIGAGAVLKAGDGATPEVFAEVPGCTTIGDIGGKGEFVEVTDTTDTTRRYIAGMVTPPDMQFTFNHMPGNTAQAAFLTQALNRETVNMQVSYPSGAQADFTVVLAGYTKQNPENNKAEQVIVYGKQSGAAAFTVA